MEARSLVTANISYVTGNESDGYIIACYIPAWSYVRIMLPMVFVPKAVRPYMVAGASFLVSVNLKAKKATELGFSDFRPVIPETVVMRDIDLC